MSILLIDSITQDIINPSNNVDCNNQKIVFGEPLIMEYKRIKLVSTKFDIFGKSQVMIVNYIKTTQTKEKSLSSVTYYDENVSPKKSFFSRKGTFEIGPFDPSQYGNPIFYYTPAYQNENIIINTQFWELDKEDAMDNIINGTQSCLSLGKISVNPYSKYFEIASDIIGNSKKIITGFIKHRELTNEHIFEIKENSYTGYYICLPEIENINEKYDILKNYKIIDDHLVKENTDLLEEYDKTYFLIKISKDKRDDLQTFDYMSSSVELIDLFNKGNKDNFQAALFNTINDAYDMQLVNKINAAYNENNKDLVKALYQHIKLDKKNWFNDLFPQIVKYINE